MDFMIFAEEPELTLKAQSLNALPVASPRLMDWGILTKFGLEEKLLATCSHIYYDQEFLDDGLLRIYKNDEIVYKELLVEFLASFKYKNGRRNKHFNTRPSIEFRLCEQQLHVSLAEFGRLLGLLGTNQDMDQYIQHLDLATIQEPPSYCFIDQWNEIGLNNHNSRACRSSDLKDPVHRLIQRLNASTILFHTQNEKVNSQHLKGLWYIMHPTDRWHLPLAMVTMFQQARDEKYSELPCGQFITTIAKKANVFNDFAEFACAKVQGKVKGYSFLVSAMILKQLPGKNNYRMYKVGEHKENEPSQQSGRAQAGTPTTDEHHTRTMDEILRQNEEMRQQNVMILNRLDHVGRYLDDMNRMVAHASHQPEAPMWNERTGHQDDAQDDEGDAPGVLLLTD